MTTPSHTQSGTEKEMFARINALETAFAENKGVRWMAGRFTNVILAVLTAFIGVMAMVIMNAAGVMREHDKSLAAVTWKLDTLMALPRFTEDMAARMDSAIETRLRDAAPTKPEAWTKEKIEGFEVRIKDLETKIVK